MKIRNDYVSNSSSSSFIMVECSTDATESVKKEFSGYSSGYPYVFPNQDYKHRFGWEYENTFDFGGKMNFIGIQLLYLYAMNMSGEAEYMDFNGNMSSPGDDFDRLYAMLKKVCLEKFNLPIDIDTSLVKKDHWTDNTGLRHEFWELDWDYHIDHQSCVTEGACMEMFGTEKSLTDFLADAKSHIKGGNDNYPEEDR